jgi:CRISPR-associated endoribonuclease Cas6
LYNGIIKSKEFCYKDYTLKIQKVYHKQHKHIQKTPVLLKTASPIWIKDKNNQSIEIEDPRYIIELNYICNEILEAYRGEGLIQALELEPVDMRKKVVKQAIRAFSENTSKDTYYTNCYEGVFKLKGNLLDLNDLLQLGLGFRRSAGYGLIEMV